MAAGGCGDSPHPPLLLHDPAADRIIRMGREHLLETFAAR